MKFRILSFALPLSLALIGCDLVAEKVSPYSPHSVTATGGIGQATIEWDAVSAEGDSASIRYTARAVQDPSHTCSTVGALSCVVTGLTNGTSYTFTVIATGAGGPSPRSGPSNAVTPSAVPGLNWQRQVSGTTDMLNGVVWTGARFVAVGGGYTGSQLHATILTSSDGVAWENAATISGGLLYSVEWTGNLLVAVGGTSSRNLVLTSPNGVTWTERTVPASNTNLRKVRWGDNRLIAVGDAGRLLTSMDGVTWTSLSSGALASNLTSVLWTGTRWIVTGWKSAPSYQGVLLSSTNGTSWTTSGVTGVLGPLVWTGDRVFGAGLGDSTWTSTDGVGWTGSGSNVTGIVDAAWTGGEFTAIATGGENFGVSPDGVTWTLRAIDPRGYGYVRMNALAATADKRVLVGENGDIRVSP